MAGLDPIIQEFRVIPDVTRLHAVAVVLEKHIGALRADLRAVPRTRPRPGGTPGGRTVGK